MGSQGNALGGTMIIAGTAIGAGMLALPMISAGMWIYWSLLLMVLTWMLMLRASQAILEVNLHYEPGSSFHTLVQDTLGPVWSTINGLAVAFVLYILVYAYVSGGGSTVQQTVMAVTGNDPGMMGSSLFFSLILMACVWWSTRFVDRLSVILMGGMVLTFILSMTGMLSQIRLPVLLDPVSYTHLDVYKRQPPCRSWKANLCCSSGLATWTPSRCAWTPRIPPRLSSWWSLWPPRSAA